jgi:hypothetical protein
MTVREYDHHEREIALRRPEDGQTIPPFLLAPATSDDCNFSFHQEIHLLLSDLRLPWELEMGILFVLIQTRSGHLSQRSITFSVSQTVDC